MQQLSEGPSPEHAIHICTEIVSVQPFRPVLGYCTESA